MNQWALSVTALPLWTRELARGDCDRMRRFRPELLVGEKVRLPGLRPALTRRLTAEEIV